MNIGERFKKARIELHITQKSVAEILGITQSAYGRIELGGINATDRLIKQFCEQFNISEEWLKKGKGQMFKPFDVVDSIKKHLTPREEQFFRIYFSFEQNKRDAFLEILSSLLKS